MMVTQLLWVFAMSLYLEFALDPRTRKILSLRLTDSLPPSETRAIPLKTLISDIHPGHVIEVDRSHLDTWVSQIATDRPEPG
jgi:hypothetical protein